MNNHNLDLDKYVDELIKGNLNLEKLNEILKSGNLAALVRRRFLEKKFNIILPALASTILDFDELSEIGIKDTIGAIQIPMSLVGPFQINGANAKGEFYVPLATLNVDIIDRIKRGLRIVSLSKGIETQILENLLVISIIVDNSPTIKVINQVIDYICKSISPLNSNIRLSKSLIHTSKNLMEIELIFENYNEVNKIISLERVQNIINDLRNRFSHDLNSMHLKGILHNTSVIARTIINKQSLETSRSREIQLLRKYMDTSPNVLTQFNESDLESLIALLLAIGQDIGNILCINKYFWLSFRNDRIEILLLLSDFRIPITNKIHKLPTHFEILRILNVVDENYFLNHLKLVEIIAALLLVENIGFIII